MLRITLKKNSTTKEGGVIHQFKFLRYLGVSRWNTCKLLMRIHRGHMVLVQTLTDVKKVYVKFYNAEPKAYKVGLERDIFNVSTALKEGKKFKFVQDLKLNPYENVCARIYISREPV